ncbi:MAG: RICIN domain-containing protein [Kofleriaceae bacterium]
MMLRSFVLCAALGGICWADDYQVLRESGGRCLDATPESVVVRECKDVPSQHWKTSPVSGGFMKLSTEGAPDLCLDILNDGAGNDQLRLAKCTNASGQNWKIKPHNADTISMTTQWRGEKLCLAFGGDHPQLASCISGSRWKLESAESEPAPSPRPSRRQPDANGRRFESEPEPDPPFDGEIAEPHNHKLDLAMIVYDCSLEIPGQPATANARVFRCYRDGSDMVCRVQSAMDMDEVFGNTPGQKAFRAAISKDTGSTVVFATPKGVFKFTTDTKAQTVSIKQARSICAKGQSLDAETFRGMSKTYHEKHPVEDHQSYQSGGPVKAAPTAPKGDEKGRMCGKPSDCQSGVCKMENKTRGRCQ